MMHLTCFQSTTTWCKIYHHFRPKIGYLDLNQNSTGKDSGERLQCFIHNNLFIEAKEYEVFCHFEYYLFFKKILYIYIYKPLCIMHNNGIHIVHYNALYLIINNCKQS